MNLVYYKFWILEWNLVVYLHLYYHLLTEEFWGCNKQVLFVFCDGYFLSTSTLYVGFVSSEICTLAPTHTFLQVTHKNIPVIQISHHIPKVNFYYQLYFSIHNTSLTWKIALSHKNYTERYTQLECCYKFTIFAFFAKSVKYMKLRFWWAELEYAHGKNHHVKMFNQLMNSFKIILCLESQENIIELSVHTSTYTN